MNHAGKNEAILDITEHGWREKEKKMGEFYNLLPTREDLCGGAPGKLGDGESGTRTIQQKCLDIGFEYWRAPDSHGVTCTVEQAVALLEDLLCVEVEIKMKEEENETIIDGCMKLAAEWCIAFRNRTNGDGDVMAADAARNALKDALHAAITSAGPNARLSGPQRPAQEVDYGTE